MPIRPLLVAALLGLAPAAFPADWPQWRGPNRDGKLDRSLLPAKLSTEPGKEWKVEVGEGHASPVAAKGRVFVFARQGEEEVVLCLDPADGKQRWRSSYSAPYEPDPAARAHGKGPKSTPTAGGNRLYTLGISGILSALDLDTGDVRWRKEFSKVFKRTSPLYGTAASPLIEGELLIADVGGHDGGALTAFEAATGDVRWSVSGDGPGYCSPIAVELAGERQVVTQTQSRVVGVSVSSGKLLWQIPFKTPYDQNIVTPVTWRDLLIYSGLEQGVKAIRLAKEGGELVPREVWRTGEVSCYMSSPVLEGDLLFGHSHKKKGQFFCLDAATGKIRWTSDGGQGENAALLGAGDTLIALTTDARLAFIKAAGDRYQELARWRVASSPTWAHPLFLPDRVLIKDRNSLISLSLKDKD